MRVASIVILAILAACGSVSASVSATATTSGDPTGSWVLGAGSSAGRPVPVLEDHPITMTLRGTEISGRAACNGYGTRFTASGGGISIEPPAQELVGCEAEVQAAEEAFLAALPRVTSMRMDGATLLLEGPDTQLRFVRLPEPPMSEIVGRTWVLESVFVGDVAAEPGGEAATLILHEDGSFAGSTGCRSFTGTWIVAGNQIAATTFAMADSVCPAALADQDGQVVGVIGDGFVPTVEGGLLTLRDPGGVGLVYRPAE